MVISEDLAKHIKEKKGVILVSGRTAMGKSTFVMEMVRDLTSADMNDIAVIILNYQNYYGYTHYCVFNAEMKVQQGERSRRPSIWQHFLKSNPQIEIVYDESLSNSQFVFERVVEYLSAQKGVKCILIDELREVPSKLEKPVMYRKDECYLSTCLSFLQELAARYDMTFIVEHIPNMALEQRKHKRPGLDDLMIKPEVLSNLNSIIMLYRDSYYYRNSTDKGLEVQEIRIRKIDMKTLNVEEWDH